MILKLLKHEVKYLWKLKCTVFVLMIVLCTLFAGLVRFLNSALGDLGVSISAIISPLYYGLYAQLSLIIPAGVAVLCIVRFVQTFVGKEAYLMLSLPVSIHSRLITHMLTTALWLGATAVSVVLSDVIMSLITRNYIGGIATFFFGTFFEVYKGIAIIVSVAMFVYICLHIYACISVGFSFDRGKVGISVAMFAFTAFAELGITLLLVPVLYDKFEWLTHEILTICFCGLFGVLYYFLTVYFLKNELNVE